MAKQHPATRCNIYRVAVFLFSGTETLAGVKK
jgi:hypothetical protein